MTKKTCSAEQIRDEVHRRLNASREAFPNQGAMLVPLPTAHPLDAGGRNWAMNEVGDESVRDAHTWNVIEEARREFFLSDDAEHDELMGSAAMHI